MDFKCFFFNWIIALFQWVSTRTGFGNLPTSRLPNPIEKKSKKKSHLWKVVEEKNLKKKKVICGRHWVRQPLDL